MVRFWMTLSFLSGWFATLSGGPAPANAAGEAAAAEGAPSLDIPVRCRIGQDCFVQNYVDTDPGPGARDFACGRLTYDGHKGTDFRVPDLAAMRRGVAVVAAAPGTVARVRDGVEDVSIRQSGGPPAGREAGNAVVVDHGNGWETQYSHLRRGSVQVRPGDRVLPGTPLGLIGLSGNTEFPHVDFAVRHQGRVVDPYTGGEQEDPGAKPGVGQGAGRKPEQDGAGRSAACDAAARIPSAEIPSGNIPSGNIPSGKALWAPAAREALGYRATGLLNAGFATGEPKAETARDGGYDGVRPAPDTPVLGAWAEIFGGQEGDRLNLRVTGPDGRLLHETGGAVPRPLAALFVGTAVPKRAGSWPAGTYRVTVRLLRGDRPVVDETRSVELR